MGTNKCASQAGMTAYGTRRHLYDPKTHTDKPYDQTTISLQMGTNKGASQNASGPLALQNRTVPLQIIERKFAKNRNRKYSGLKS
uniref:Uncharacterized protein n=1 Tax=Xiphophorus couchianus TaxID=32473 RepID=A0A3B5KMW3_9TELE